VTHSFLISSCVGSRLDLYRAFDCHRSYCRCNSAAILSKARFGVIENGSKKNNSIFLMKIAINYLPIQHSSFEQGFVLATSGGSTPI
jgi:hypothetical protein